MASDLDTIQEVRIVATTEGDQEAVRAMGQVGTAIDSVVVKTDNLSKAQISAQRQLDATARKYDQEYRALQDLARAQQVLDRARSQGLAGSDAFLRAQDAINAKLAQVSQQTLAAAASIQQLAQASGAQSSINFSVGVADDFDAAARAKDIEAYGKSLDELQARFDPLFAAQQQYRAEVQAISAAEQVGALTQDKAAKAIDNATNRYNNQRIEIQKSEDANARLAKGVGLNAYAWQNLSYQVNDVITSLASGISPFQTLAQQGGQIYQILQTGQGGVGGALKGIADRLLAINPLVGVFGALAVGIGLAAVAANSFLKAQRDVQLALLGVGQGAGVSADQIQKIAESASATSTITVAAARDIEKAFLESGKVYGDVFAKGITAADDFAKASQQDVGASAKFIAGALANLGGGGFEDLAKRAGNFDAAFEKTVRDAIQSGDDLKAQQLVVERFGEAFSTAKEKLTPLQSALQSLDQAFKNSAESFGRYVTQLGKGSPISTQLEQAQQARRNIVALSESTGATPDTSAVDAKIKRLSDAYNEQTATVQKNATAVRANADANEKVVSSISAPVSSLKQLQDGYTAANKAVNAFESQQAAGVNIPVDQYKAAKESLAGYSAGLKDYQVAGGAANMEMAKAKEVLAANLRAIQAVTPEQKAEAERQKALADAYGTSTSAAQRTRTANDAYTRTMAESAQATVNANRATDESAKTSNQLADATTRTGNSVEFLRAKRQAETEAANGTISQSDVETRTKKILAEQIATLNAQRAADIRSARDSAGAQQRANDAVASGRIVSAEAARQVQLYNQQAQLQREIDAASGEEKAALTARMKELTSATEAQLDADKRAQVLSMSEETKRQIDTLQKEGELLGSNNRDRAIALAQLQAEQNLQRQGISVSAPESVAYINQEKLKADLTYAKDQYTRLAQDISSAIGGIFDDLTSNGKKTFASFADSFSKNFSRIGSRVLEQNIIQPLISGSLDGKGSSSSFFSNLANLFDGEKLQKAVSVGSEQGIFSGLSSLLKPRSNGASNGGFATSALGQGLVSAGIGASIGYQSQSPLIGAAGGALAGFAVGGPIGALVGGGAGLLGGIFGEDQAKKAAKKQLQQELQARKEALDQARPQIEALAINFEGGSVGNVGKQIADAQAQMIQAAKVASDGGDRALADKLVADFKLYMARMTAAFADGFNGTLDEVKAGFGLNGPFAQAVSQVQQLGEAIKGFVTDSGRLGPAAVAAAQGAAVQGLLSQLDEPKELSATQTELSRIQGTAAGLNQVLKDLGMSADDAAKVISERTVAALDTLRDKFNDDLGRKINDAQNKGYLNDAADLVKEVAGLQNDAQSVGGNLDQVQTYFQAAAQKIVDGSQLTGDAFNSLVQQFPQLAGQVHAFSADSTKSVQELADAAAKSLSEIQDRKRAYEDRAFAVNFSDNSLSTKLTAFDRSAEWEQWEEMAKGGQALNDLLATQGLERDKLIYDYNSAVKDRETGFQDRQFAATNDTSTLQGQLAEFDRKAAEEREAEVKAGGDAINDLEKAQAAERLKIIDDFGKQAADALKTRLQGYDDRLFAATNDSSTLPGQLAAYDRQAAKDRATEVEAGGQAIAQLEAAQGAERLKIITDFAQQASDALNARLSGYADRLFAATNDSSTLEGQLAAYDRQAEKDQAAEIQAGGQAINQLEEAQGAERLKIISDYASQATDALNSRLEGYSDRLFSATTDSNTLVGQLAAFDRQAAKDRAAEVKAGGDAIVELEQTQSVERLKIVTDFAQQAAEALTTRLKGYADRYFAATNDSSTLEGQLAAYDRQALSEREDEIKAGGDAIAELEQTQAAERLKIITDFGKQAADALQQQMQEAQTAYESFAKNIKTYLDGLKTGSSSPLAPKDRLAEAQSQYDAQLALARTGDRTALDNITQYASALLDASKAYNASSSAYQATFQQVQSTLAALPTQVSAEQFIVNAINDSKTALVSATQAMQAQLLAGLQANSPILVAAALNANFSMLDTSVNGLLDYNEFLAGLGPLATSAEQQAARTIFNAIDANGDGQLSKLEIQNASSGRVEAYTASTNQGISSANLLLNGQNDLINADNALSQQQVALLSALNNLTNTLYSVNLSLYNVQQQQAAIIADSNSAIAQGNNLSQTLIGVQQQQSSILNQGNALYSSLISVQQGQSQILNQGNALSTSLIDVQQQQSSLVSQGNSIMAQGNSIVDQGNSILGGLKNLSDAQLSNQQQLVSLNSSINDQNGFIRGNTAYTNVALQQQAQTQGDTFTLLSQTFGQQSRMLQNLQSANIKNGAPAYATGGWVSGPGTSTSDSIVARLSNGEFVVTAAAARIYGPALEAMNDNRFSMPAMAMPVPVAAGIGGNDAMLAELRALRSEVASLRAENREDSLSEQATIAAGARHVREGVDEHRAETRKGNTDRRQDASRPRTAGTRAA